MAAALLAGARLQLGAYCRSALESSERCPTQPTRVHLGQGCGAAGIRRRVEPDRSIAGAGVRPRCQPVPVVDRSRPRCATRRWRGRDGGWSRVHWSRWPRRASPDPRNLRRSRLPTTKPMSPPRI